jgi:hypothetical protein
LKKENLSLQRRKPLFFSLKKWHTRTCVLGATSAAQMLRFSENIFIQKNENFFSIFEKVFKNPNFWHANRCVLIM